jgi:hypothetical protein
MVRDESSANGQKPHAETDSATHQVPQSTHAPESPLGSGNLTQELAQLLAATIAHNQAQRGTGGGVPTGADLASLASLMSAASQHRTLAPMFKDGLSALSYTQPHAGHSQSGPPDIGDHHDDEPMPIPSTWRQPPASETDRWFRQQMGAAILGLAAGLMIVVPTVLWLSGWLGGGQKPKGEQKVAAAATVTAPAGDFGRAAEIKTVKVQVRPLDRPAEPASQFVTGSVEARLPGAEAVRQSETAMSIATVRAPDPQRARTDELLAQATRRIQTGDIGGARELLAGADGQAQPLASFALAETYDPNMLAAWGTRGAVADVAKARALYGKALTMGVGKAQVRLDGLK